MKSIKSIAIAVSSLFVLPAGMVQAASAAPSPSPKQTGLAIMRLYQSNYSAHAPKMGGEIWLSLRQDFRLSEVNANLVRNHESRFVANRSYFNRTLARSVPYMYHIVNEVQRRGMPAEIALLPFIESAYVTKARSHVGASGLWQFMPATGRHYGLEQTPMYDGRHDISASTNAALNYLQYLHGLFGDWTLALAAYNWGEGNVSRAIRRAQAAGLAPTYENLNMPAETRNYVPKLLAVRNLVNNPHMFGLQLPSIKHEPYFRAVTVSAPLDIMAAAHLANISESEFLALNPAFKTPVFIPKENRQMLLPVQAANTFEANYRESDPKTLLSWDVFTPTQRISVADLASQTGSSPAEFRRLNGISGNYVNAGRTVLVNRNTMQGIGNVNAFVKADFDPVPDTFVEQAPVLAPPVAAAHTPRPSLAANTFAAPPQAADVVIVTPPLNLTPPAPETPPPNTAAAEKQPAPLPTTQTASTETADTPTEHISAPAPAEEPPIRIAQADTETAAKTPEPAESAPKVQAALEEPAADKAPETPNVAANQTDSSVQDDDDELWVVAQAAQAKMQAAETVRATVAQSDAASTHERTATETRRRTANTAAAPKPAPQERVRTAEKPAAERTRMAEKPAAERNRPAPAQTYKVEQGDTVYSIAKRYNISTDELIAANQIRNNRLSVGQTLKVSGNAAANVQAARNGNAPRGNSAAKPAEQNARHGNQRDAKPNAQPAHNGRAEKPDTPTARNNSRTEKAGVPAARNGSQRNQQTEKHHAPNTRNTDRQAEKPNAQPARSNQRGNNTQSKPAQPAKRR